MLTELLIFAGAIAEKLGVTLVARKIERHIPDNPIQRVRSRLLWTHKRKLRSTLESMPFIYRDLETDVLNDFVDITHQSLDLVSLSERKDEFGPTIKYTEKQLAEVLSNGRRVVFLGNAGMGKSTFQRHAILKVLHGQSEFFDPKVRWVPFYVPLKIVDNSAPNPILNHLLRTVPLLAGKSGLRKLIKLANAQELLLFLDGYDEIQLIDSNGTNYIQEELNEMMKADSFSPSKTVPQEPKHKDFYKSLSNCRIWLSSRTGFFAEPEYRVKLSRPPNSVGVYALELLGIGNNRIRLIASIFNQYRRKKAYEGLFDERYFLQQIDEAPNIRELSENPLWLTVMSYTYAREVIEKRDSDIQSPRSQYDLISQFLILLLEDLDEAKIRQLHKPARKASRADRNLYIPEKRSFLSYFAAQLFCAEDSIKKVFDLGYIEDKARAYFQEDKRSSNRLQILNSLAHRGPSNFAVQLIRSGVFVVVHRTDRKLYDFPHMRFREVLACEYFNEHGYSFLLKNIRKRGLSELLYFAFNQSRAQDQILEALFEAATETPEDDYIQGLIINCFKRPPHGYNPSRAIHAFLQKCIDKDISFRLPAELLTDFTFDSSFIDMLKRGFKEALVQQKMKSLFLSCTLLSRFDPALLEELTHVLVPSLERRREFAIEAVLAFPTLYKNLRKWPDKPRFIEHFIYLKENFTAIKKVNGHIPFFPDNTIDNIYLVTDEVIKATQNYVRRMGFPSDEIIRRDLEPHKHKVYFTKRYLTDSQLSFDKTAKRIAIRHSSFDYPIYLQVMKAIENTKDSMRNLTFFVPYVRRSS